MMAAWYQLLGSASMGLADLFFSAFLITALLSGLGESLVSAVGLTSAHCSLSANQ